MSRRGARVRAEALSFAYQHAAGWAVSEVDLEADPGRLTWLTGPNASGKSTLLQLAAGVIPKVIGGHVRGTLDVRGARDGQAIQTSIVMQDSGVYLFRTVRDELAFPLENAGVPGAEIDARVGEALDLLGVGRLDGRLMHTLSGGERQKVAVAAALCVSPDLLLLDEPFEQLDPQAAAEVLEIARGAAREGATVIVASRRGAHAAPDEPRIELADGRVARVGSAVAESLGARPARTLGDRVLSFDAVTHRYPTGGGVSDASLDVRAGEAVALLGPNGAGKSTLMKHANGLLRPSRGAVRVLGEDIARRGVHEVARDVGLLFQDPDDQIFNARVDREVAWALTSRGLRRDAALDNARPVMDELGIGHLAEENPHELTTSQRQLVALASILVAEPRVIVLDEPTKALDAAASRVVAEALDRRLAEGCALLLVTHDAPFARRMAERGVRLEDGRIVADDSIGSLLPGPDSAHRTTSADAPTVS